MVIFVDKEVTPELWILRQVNSSMLVSTWCKAEYICSSTLSALICLSIPVLTSSCQKCCTRMWYHFIKHKTYCCSTDYVITVPTLLKCAPYTIVAAAQQLISMPGTPCTRLNPVLPAHSKFACALGTSHRLWLPANHIVALDGVVIRGSCHSYGAQWRCHPWLMPLSFGRSMASSSVAHATFLRALDGIVIYGSCHFRTAL